MNTQLLLLLFAAIAAFFLIRMFLNARPAISPQEAHAAVEAGTAVLVDVREPEEWKSGVAAPAFLLSLSDLRGERQGWGPFLQKHRGDRIIVYCHSGARCASAAALLKAEGYDTVNLGGFSRWAGSALPVRHV